MSRTDYLDLAAIADLLGIGVPSARTYKVRADRNRREGNPRPGDLPEPDTYFGSTPVWRPATITDWMSRRPGKGAGGGRKPRASQS